MPITLQYHAGGFKAHEVAPTTGLGWNLNTSSVDFKITDTDSTEYNSMERDAGLIMYTKDLSSDYKFNTAYTYDKQGNVLTLARRGNMGTSTYETIDNLTLSYQGNQLIKAEDAAAAPTLSMSMDFKDGAHQSIEYAYDENGNQVKDLNKGISKISYNSLNLPSELIISNSKGAATNTYLYGADGRKLKVTMKWGTSNSKSTDYMGNMIYENGTLKRILVVGGYIEGGIYHYYLQDHLGNNRVVAKADGTVVQANHYYPFGMAFAEGMQNSNQPYRYNGKELDTERGLNLYDYSARQMEAIFGRFISVDPMAEKYYSISPYTYCLNNPIYLIDPTGMSSSPYYDKYGRFLGVDENGFMGHIFITDKKTFDKNAIDGIANSKQIQADKNTVSIKKVTLSLQAESRVYTHVLKEASDPKLDISKLYNGEISIRGESVMRPDGTKIGKGYNDPAYSETQSKFSQGDVDNQIRVSVSKQSNQTDLFTVESIWSFLGVHEYWGHGIKRWNGDANHWRCYDAQIRHSSFKRLPIEQQKEIIKKYEYFKSH